MAIVRTAKGTATDKTGANTLTVASVQIPKDTTMIVGVTYDAGSGDPTMTWDDRTYTEVRFRQQALGIRTAYFSMFNNGATRTSDVVLAWNNSPTAKAMFVTQVDNIKHRDVMAVSSGTSVSPSSTGIANNYADAYLTGIFGSEGPEGDTAGTPSFSFISGQRAGTTGGGASTNVTIHETYKITALVQGSAEAAKTEATSRDWIALMVSMKPVFSVSKDFNISVDDIEATSQAEADQYVEDDVLGRFPPNYTVTII